MGFLDDLKKNLGFEQKDEQKNEEQRNEEQQAQAEGQADASAEAAEAASVEAAAQQQAAEAAAADAAAQQQAAEAQAARVTEVVVKSGDTLSGIAVQFGVDLNALIAVNADIVPNPDLIYPGQVLRLP